MKSYEVGGRRYRVLGSSGGFVQRGTASWYGPGFHGRLTASGEVYDMEAYTAAHRTLPLGTYVRVRRVDGGGQVVVRINDRGPFVKGRIIDLSRAGARRLHMLDEGVAEVVVEAMGKKEKGGRNGEVLLRARPDYRKGVFSVQVGAFTVKENAVRLARSLKRRFGNSSISLYDRGDHVFYRVMVGRFSDEDMADALKNRLMGSGEFQEAFVVAR